MSIAPDEGRGLVTERLTYPAYVVDHDRMQSLRSIIERRAGKNPFGPFFRCRVGTEQGVVMQLVGVNGERIESSQTPDGRLIIARFQEDIDFNSIRGLCLGSNSTIDAITGYYILQSEESNQKDSTINHIHPLCAFSMNWRNREVEKVMSLDQNGDIQLFDIRAEQSLEYRIASEVSESLLEQVLGKRAC